MATVTTQRTHVDYHEERFVNSATIGALRHAVAVLQHATCRLFPRRFRGNMSGNEHIILQSRDRLSFRPRAPRTSESTASNEWGFAAGLSRAHRCCR